MKYKSILDIPLVSSQPVFSNKFTKLGVPWKKRSPKTFSQKACDFWARVQRGLANECWLWTGGASSNGYGQFGVSKTNFQAHRVAWELSNGRIPDEMDILHHCDTPLCVNPNHLFIGDQLANMADCIAKGRARKARGEDAGGAKLTWGDVEDIRLRTSLGEAQKSIADSYGIHQTNVHYIAKRKTWIKDAG